MNVLIACACSDYEAAQFRLCGHNAFSVDLKPSEHNSPWHYQADAIEILYAYDWDLVVAHPECKYMCNSGAKHLYIDGWYENGRDRERWRNMNEAVAFFLKFVEWQKAKPSRRLAMENSIMHSYAKNQIGKHSQIIQPWMFGHPESKASMLWLYNLPKLTETDNVYEYMMTLPKREREKVHHMSPGKRRSAERSRTLPGIARAYAQQWGTA